VNPAAFAPPKPWTYGNSSRNGYFGPGTYTWNNSLFKSFSLPGREGLRLQARADFLNVLNHFNLGNPAAQIANTLMEELDPQGVGVVLQAEHLCMRMRGVEKQNSVVVTSTMLGVFRSHQETRQEFMSLVANGLHR